MLGIQYRYLRIFFMKFQYEEIHDKKAEFWYHNIVIMSRNKGIPTIGAQSTDSIVLKKTTAFPDHLHP